MQEKISETISETKRKDGPESYPPWPENPATFREKRKFSDSLSLQLRGEERVVTDSYDQTYEDGRVGYVAVTRLIGEVGDREYRKEYVESGANEAELNRIYKNTRDWITAGRWYPLPVSTGVQE